MPTLHGFQNALEGDVYQAWNQGAQNVLMRLDTGGGKTVILSDITHRHQAPSITMAHRSELVGQLSMSLARNGVYHNIIGSQDTRRAVAANHMAVLGKSYFNPGAPAAVASVDTLIRAQGLEGWAETVTLGTIDEAHHVVVDNKWHKAFEMFGNSKIKWLLPTATPSRADGKGLGRHADGVADVMVQGPPMRWLIDNGYLTDYRMICVESDLARMQEEVGANGDWSTIQLRRASQQSHIVGDVVREYIRWARGKLGITFCTDVETAKEITEAYRRAGIPAETLTGTTQDAVRRNIIKRFERREIWQIVAVDIISEGFDLPAIEVASFARPTASLAMFMQQFGRALRVMFGKNIAFIIDHVNNFLRHGPPDRERPWSLDRRAKRGSGGSDLLFRNCIGTAERPGCFRPYERFRTECPYCGTVPPLPTIAERTSPAMVDGDMAEVPPEVLAALRGQIEAMDQDKEEYRMQLAATGLNNKFIMHHVKTRFSNQEAQKSLREIMAIYGGAKKAEGMNDRQIQKSFFLDFGIDVYSAMALGRKEAEKLAAKIMA